jgi:hypothetical protein
MRPKKKLPLVSESERLAGARRLAKKLAPHWQAKHCELVKKASFDTAPATMAAEILERLTILQAAASGGDVSSYQVLAGVAKSACANLEITSLSQADEQRSLARKSEAWPVLLSFHPEDRERTLRMFEKLPLADDLALNQRAGPSRPKGEGTLKNGRKRRTYKVDTPVIVAVNTALAHLRLQNPGKYDLTAPEVSESKLEEWFADIWSFYSKRDDLHQHPAFRKIGLSGVRKNQGIDATSPRWVMAVKSRIKERLKAAFEEIFSVQK